MLQERMEKLVTVVTAYEPNIPWTGELFIIFLAAIVIGLLLNNLYKKQVFSYLRPEGAAFFHCSLQDE